MTDITEGGTAKGCSWYTTLKSLKAGKTRLATQKLSNSILASPSLYFHAPFPCIHHQYTTTFTPLKVSYFPPLIKCLVFGILNLFTFMGINETINNNEEDSKQKICFKYYPIDYKNIAYRNIQPEACFGKLWGWMSQGCPHLALTLVVWKMCESRK